MKKTALLLIVLLAVSATLWLVQFSAAPPPDTRQQDLVETHLQKVSLKCKVKADAAVADKVPIIEFQKLELESQREWVFYHCMQDQAYRENPAWQTAAESRTRDGEQLRQWRRAQMQLTSPQDGLPAFWIAPKSGGPEDPGKPDPNNPS